MGKIWNFELQCHPVRHWSRNGATSLDNLVLLCTKHYTLVHEGGCRIETDFQDNWSFVERCGKLCEGTAGTCLFALGLHRNKYVSV